jgi:hypothetical protein
MTDLPEKQHKRKRAKPIFLGFALSKYSTLYTILHACELLKISTS